MTVVESMFFFALYDELHGLSASSKGCSRCWRGLGFNRDLVGAAFKTDTLIFGVLLEFLHELSNALF